jgi:uncharacterized protein (DUF2141 family)
MNCFAFFYYFILFFSSVVFAQEKISLKVLPGGFSNKNGVVNVVVFKKENFLQYSEFNCSKPISENVVCEFQLPKGNYAVAVFHDEDKNFILNKNLFGIPVEAFGFSDGLKTMFRKPKYHEISFDLSEQKTISILVKKWL